MWKNVAKHVVCVNNAANFPIRWLSYKNHVLPDEK